MKKVLAIAAIAVFAVSLQSCKKDYTCDCTYSSLSVSAPLNGYKKADAEDACSAIETTYKIADSAASCTLN